MTRRIPTVVIGGGPAGALFAGQLAAAGRAAVVCEERPGWEKPCGGGVTDKALRQYPFLASSVCQHNWVEECELTSPSGRRLRLELDRPIAIFSRRALNRLLLERARQAGAAVIPARVVGCVPCPEGWRLELNGGDALLAGAVVNASGARNPLRPQLPSPLAATDWMATAGYYIPQRLLPWPPERMIIRFLPGLEGYIWSFPRGDHASAGICGRLGAESTARLRHRLEAQLTAWGIPWQGTDFYAHLLPAPSPRSLARARFGDVAPHPWALAGDAAGLVDPITGEGLYYALRSAELLADAWLQCDSPAAAVARYGAELRRHILPELESAGGIAARFFHGRFAGAAVLERMTQFGQGSALFRQLLCDLFSGAQGYVGLRRRLYRNLIPSLAQLAVT